MRCSCLYSSSTVDCGLCFCMDDFILTQSARIAGTAYSASQPAPRAPPVSSAAAPQKVLSLSDCRTSAILREHCLVVASTHCAAGIARPRCTALRLDNEQERRSHIPTISYETEYDHFVGGIFCRARACGSASRNNAVNVRSKRLRQLLGKAFSLTALSILELQRECAMQEDKCFPLFDLQQRLAGFRMQRMQTVTLPAGHSLKRQTVSLGAQKFLLRQMYLLELQHLLGLAWSLRLSSAQSTSRTTLQTLVGCRSWEPTWVPSRLRQLMFQPSLARKTTST